jgi:hypothetical protein
MYTCWVASDYRSVATRSLRVEPRKRPRPVAFASVGVVGVVACACAWVVGQLPAAAIVFALFVSAIPGTARRATELSVHGRVVRVGDRELPIERLRIVADVDDLESDFVILSTDDRRVVIPCEDAIAESQRVARFLTSEDA